MFSDGSFVFVAESKAADYAGKLCDSILNDVSRRGCDRRGLITVLSVLCSLQFIVCITLEKMWDDR